MAKQRGWWKLTTTVEPDDADRAHIAQLIEQGYTEGEIAGDDAGDEDDEEEPGPELQTRTGATGVQTPPHQLVRPGWLLRLMDANGRLALYAADDGCGRDAGGVWWQFFDGSGLDGFRPAACSWCGRHGLVVGFTSAEGVLCEEHVDYGADRSDPWAPASSPSWRAEHPEAEDVP